MTHAIKAGAYETTVFHKGPFPQPADVAKLLRNLAHKVEAEWGTWETPAAVTFLTVPMTIEGELTDDAETCAYLYFEAAP